MRSLATFRPGQAGIRYEQGGEQSSTPDIDLSAERNGTVNLFSGGT